MIPEKFACPPSRATGRRVVAEALHERGLRLTKPRRLILDVVHATTSHPSALSVYRRVRRQLPRVSLATVYRNLRTLAAEGFLHERAEVGGMRFDGNTSPHDHFTCVRCGRIYDLPASASRAVRRRVVRTTGFEVLEHRTEFYGRCVGCRNRGARQQRRRTYAIRGRAPGTPTTHRPPRVESPVGDVE